MKEKTSLSLVASSFPYLHFFQVVQFIKTNFFAQKIKLVIDRVITRRVDIKEEGDFKNKYAWIKKLLQRKYDGL
jgi:hypothetical protein